ncbi:alcohol dehydrogenase catalytic domain-containing protein [Spiroplasma endosymbiont of Polydrusus pterygomalis]|uniref:alcohol dehydrogenase catalytic domain-containing protein n=1 Tax=Spiroplasma endosymbiont of Polydrusus pterygomalis TaxID=3139327 RepID=UPI003CCA942C
MIQDATDIIVKIEEFTFSHDDYRPYLGKNTSVAPNTIMGHEGVDIITAIGENVIKLKVGDRVDIGCIIHCNICEWCEQKSFANCIKGGFTLGTKINGTHAEYVRVPHGENSVVKIPKTMSLAYSLMINDALPTGYENVIKKIDLKQIKNIAIIGDGPIGLGLLLLLKKYNKKIDIYDHHSQKLNYFKKWGHIKFMIAP